MIRYNLRCSKGHKHYSPTPQRWVGMPCGKPLGNTQDPRNTRRCKEPMKEMR